MFWLPGEKGQRWKPKPEGGHWPFNYVLLWTIFTLATGDIVSQKAELFVFSFCFLRSLHPSATVDLVTLAGSIISGPITDKEKSPMRIRVYCEMHMRMAPRLFNKPLGRGLVNSHDKTPSCATIRDYRCRRVWVQSDEFYITMIHRGKQWALGLVESTRQITSKWSLWFETAVLFRTYNPTTKTYITPPTNFP